MSVGEELIEEITHPRVAQRPLPAGDDLIEPRIALPGHAAFDDNDGLMLATFGGARTGQSGIG